MKGCESHTCPTQARKVRTLLEARNIKRIIYTEFNLYLYARRPKDTNIPKLTELPREEEPLTDGSAQLRYTWLRLRVTLEESPLRLTLLNQLACGTRGRC